MKKKKNQSGTGSCKQKQMIREINRVEIADAATKFLTRKVNIPCYVVLRISPLVHL
jgi:hypothetical protein